MEFVDVLVSECVALVDDGWGVEKSANKVKQTDDYMRENRASSGANRLDSRAFLLSRFRSEGGKPLMADSLTSTVVSRDQYSYSSQHTM